MFVFWGSLSETLFWLFALLLMHSYIFLIWIFIVQDWIWPEAIFILTSVSSNCTRPPSLLNDSNTAKWAELLQQLDFHGVGPEIKNKPSRSSLGVNHLVLRKSARVICSTTHVSVFRHARVPEVVILMPSTSGHHSETLAQFEWWTQHYQHSRTLLHHNTGMNVSEPTAETNRYEQERRHRH